MSGGTRNDMPDYDESDYGYNDGLFQGINVMSKNILQKINGTAKNTYALQNTSYIHNQEIKIFNIIDKILATFTIFITDGPEKTKTFINTQYNIAWGARTGGKRTRKKQRKQRKTIKRMKQKKRRKTIRRRKPKKRRKTIRKK